MFSQKTMLDLHRVFTETGFRPKLRAIKKLREIHFMHVISLQGI
jgi:hypothetical protein